MSYGLTLAHRRSSQAQQTFGTPHGAPKRYPAKFRRKVLDLFASGRPEAEAQVAYDLQICAQLSYP